MTNICGRLDSNVHAICYLPIVYPIEPYDLVNNSYMSIHILRFRLIQFRSSFSQVSYIKKTYHKIEKLFE
jgi:hypothetical protein